MRPTRGWIWIDGVKYEKGTEPRDNANEAHMVMEDIKPFISPIDGTEITSRPLRDAHMRQHGVTNSSDYSPEFLHKRRLERERRMTGNTARDRAQRIELIKRAIR